MKIIEKAKPIEKIEFKSCSVEIWDLKNATLDEINKMIEKYKEIGYEIAFLPEKNLLIALKCI